MISELFQLPEQPLLIEGSYSAFLVVLSLLVAIFSSGAALFSVDISKKNLFSWQRQIALLIGSLSLGIGVWSMHFIGMLAFALCTQVTYSVSVTFLSLLPSILASWVALNLLVQNNLSIRQLLAGGVLVGSGIGAMHYSGMAAMQMAVQLYYDPFFFGLSILVAVGMAFLALWIRFGVRSLQAKLTHWQLNVLSGLVMGLAISAMHYTGMLAARFVAPAGFIPMADVSNSKMLALAVTSVTLVITLLVLLLQVLLKFYQAKRVTEDYAGRISSIMDTVLDTILTLDKNGLIVEHNEAALQLFKPTNNSLAGRHFSEFLYASDAQELEQILALSQHNKQFQVKGAERQFLIRTDDDNNTPVRLALSQTQVDDELLYVACLNDISAQIRFSETLKQSEQKFRSLIQNIPGAAYRCLSDADWTMIFISERVESISGYPAVDFMLPNPVRSWSSLIVPEDQPMVAQTNYEQAFRIEYRIRHKDGSIRWMLEYGDTVHDDSSIIALDGFIMDITERRHIEEQLLSAKLQAEHAAEAKSAFLANMSHEIRTPLNAVIGFTELLRENPARPELPRYLATIHDSARSLLVLLNDILDSAKLEKGKLDLEYHYFNITELLDGVISTLWVNARKKQLELQLIIDPALADVYFGAGDRLRQVLLNLVGNAIKFTSTGFVHLHINQITPDSVEFKVIDSGIGIAPERLSRIFEPFTQADASMSRRFGGTGLGTTISKQLIELMGGKIFAESIEGQGSTFTIQIPLKAGTANQKLPPVQHNTKLPALQILIADDIAQNLELLTAILERDGHTVTAVSDGEQVLQALAEFTPDLLLLDVQMPILDGLSAARLRREQEVAENLPALPMIALTASALIEDKLAARDAGIDGFCSKPIVPYELNAEIARVLQLTLSANEPVPQQVSADIISLEKGAQLWGSKQRYINEVKRFVNDQSASAITELNSLLQSNNWTALKAKAHGLKGLSANLMLKHFPEQLQQLEQQCKLQDSASAAALLQMLDAMFTQLSLHPALQQSTDSELNISVPQHKLLELLNSLLKQVQQNDYADDTLEQLIQIEHSHYQQDIVSIHQDIEQFDFNAAEAKLTQLLAKLQA